jgi:integrase
MEGSTFKRCGCREELPDGMPGKGKPLGDKPPAGWGEACALRWSDVLLEYRMLNVKSSLVQVGPKWIEAKPKTDSGERRVDLGERTVSLLLRVQLAQGHDRARWGAAYQDNESSVRP